MISKVEKHFCGDEDRGGQKVKYLRVCVHVHVPQLAEVGQHPTGVEVVCDHAAARRQAGPDVGPHHKPRLHRFLGQETCQTNRKR